MGIGIDKEFSGADIEKQDLSGREFEELTTGK